MEWKKRNNLKINFMTEKDIFDLHEKQKRVRFMEEIDLKKKEKEENEKNEVKKDPKKEAKEKDRIEKEKQKDKLLMEKDE